MGDAFVGNRDALRRAALAIVGSPERADDVVQDAYLRVHAVDSVGELQQPLRFCFRVVRNLALDHWRRSAFEQDLLVHEDEGQHVPAETPTPERHAMARQSLAIADKVLSGLPTRTREVFELYHLKGLTQRDIGRELGVSVGLVNALIREATDALRFNRCRPEPA